MNFTTTNRAILVRILQLSRLAVSGSENQERPKCKNNELGFLYDIKDPFLRADTHFQRNRLKTVRGVSRTKTLNDRTGISLKIMHFRSANWSMREILNEKLNWELEKLRVAHTSTKLQMCVGF